MSYDDWHAETQSRLEKSALYVALKTRCAQDSCGPQVLALVDEATFFSFQKTKTIVKHMGEFTLHDGDHLFRVLSLMERLLSPQHIAALSIPELMLLILSAFFHDIGMAAEEKHVNAWRAYWDALPELSDDEDAVQLARFRRHCASHPAQIGQIEALSAQGNESRAGLQKDYLISDYIRLTHADRAREIIEKHWIGKVRYRDTDLTVEFAAICFSHNEDAVSLLQWDKRYLCGPDTVACLPFVAVILRLADLLDFDAKRTPAILFSHLFVRHPVSIREWNKHRAVEAWSISSSTIQFQAKCKHPAIQASIHAFCDVIDQELSVCNNILTTLNDFHNADRKDLVLRVPFKVDRSRIETRKTIDGKPEFTYRETQFNLSKRQVIDLLMGTKLYGNPAVALRELLQNSIDACLLRAAMEKSWGNPYEPRVRVKYSIVDGEDVLDVEDNGIGMDQYIIDNYYSRVGASFYKSSDFYDLKAQSKADFVPTSRFGIGILSCFMVADTLIVDTRKVYEPHASSDPLNLRVEGQESIFWIKPGTRAKPGTSTRLILRKNKHPWQRMSEDEFIKSVENVLPNPPFEILIEGKSSSKRRDANSFKFLKAPSLKDYSWSEHKNIKEVELEFDDPKDGFVGSAVVAILQTRGKPVQNVEMLSKSVKLDGNEYVLRKSLKAGENFISLNTTSITIDDSNQIESSDSTSRLCQSHSLLSLHGIEVPTTMFPDRWSVRENQAQLQWPISVLLVIDVCGTMDLDLNSSRTQVIVSEKWVAFEEHLSRTVFLQLARKLGPTYWARLKSVLTAAGTKNDTFHHIIDAIS